MSSKSRLPKSLQNLPFLAWVLICVVALGLFPITLLLVGSYFVGSFMDGGRRPWGQ